MEEFRLDNDMMEHDALYNCFELSTLWGYYQNIFKLKEKLVELKKVATINDWKDEIARINKQLYYVCGNMSLIKDVMIEKEVIIFEEKALAYLCRN